MDHTKILKRAWHILWRYRLLWLFGFILALTTASGGSPQASYSIGSNDFDRGRSSYRLEDLDPELQTDLEEAVEGMVEFFSDGIPTGVSNTVIAVGVGVGLFILVLVIVGKIFRYVSETALIRLVDEYEETEEARSVRYGFRLGWSRSAWRLFLIDLLVGIPVFLVFLLFFLLALAPLLMWGLGTVAFGVVGTVASIGFGVLLAFLAIIVSVILGFLKHFFRRACVLEELGVIEAIRRGYLVARQNLKDAGIMWLIMVGISIGWTIVMIPVGILILLMGGLVAGVAGLAVGGLTGLFLNGIQPWIFAAAAGLPIFLVLISCPLAFLNGLRVTFVSSTWTLTYRELTALEPNYLKELPEPTPPEDDEDDEDLE